MNKIIALIGAFILLGGCSKSGLEGKYFCDGKLLNGLEFKGDGKGYANIRGRETAFEYTIDEDRIVLTANGESNVVTIKGDSLVGDAAYGTCFPMSSNPLFGEWKMESIVSKQGHVISSNEGENVYVTFFPGKMIMRDGSNVDTVTVLDYAIEDRQVVLTTEARGEQNVIQVQILEEDKVKLGDGTGEGAILRRIGAASSE